MQSAREWLEQRDTSYVDRLRTNMLIWMVIAFCELAFIVWLIWGRA